ncbi:hypothetical protein D5b_00359 [Faustovirus]|nr:hypothetical protein D5b_00359 [Faustovirus]AMN84554.1 hypothetical protein D6_00148 [Faustovirus]AMP44303.1 hypothetical protein PRJ_Dakar_00351 [Faustovirus]QKE50253.1 hypothetical protein F-VV10_0133 [Faustovirus]
MANLSTSDNGVYEFVGFINENKHTYYATVNVTRIYVAPYGIYPIKHNYVFISDTSTFVIYEDENTGNYTRSTHVVLTDEHNIIHYNERPFSIEHYILCGKKCALDKDSLEMDNTQLAIKFGDIVFEIGLSDISRDSCEVKAMMLDRILQLGEAIHKFLLEQKKIKEVIECLTNSV